MGFDPNSGPVSFVVDGCPACSRLAFHAVQRREAKITLAGRPPKVEMVLIAVECPWCRNISEPVRGSDGKTYWKRTQVPLQIQVADGRAENGSNPS